MLMVLSTSIQIIITAIIVGLFMLLVFSGMYRFESKKKFGAFWIVVGLFSAFGSYFALRADVYIIFWSSSVATVFLFFRDLRKLKSALIKVEESH